VIHKHGKGKSIKMAGVPGPVRYLVIKKTRAIITSIKHLIRDIVRMRAASSGGYACYTCGKVFRDWHDLQSGHCEHGGRNINDSTILYARDVNLDNLRAQCPYCNFYGSKNEKFKAKLKKEIGPTRFDWMQLWNRQTGWRPSFREMAEMKLKLSLMRNFLKNDDPMDMEIATAMVEEYQQELYSGGK